MTIQATSWQAQMNDISKKVGGMAGDPEVTRAVNVSEVDISQLKVFSIIHNTFTHTHYVPTNKWYGLPAGQSFSYPTQYLLQDGTTLTVDYDETLDRLILFQV